MSTDDEVFVYMGPGGESPPQSVVRVRVDPSVTSIPAGTFWGRNKLTEVELCEGLVEIGERSFEYCDHSIKKIIIPTSLRRINDSAFLLSLSDVLFVSSMALKALEMAHSISASSPILESHPSSL
jgi:hypothetical protein